RGDPRPRADGRDRRRRRRRPDAGRGPVHRICGALRGPHGGLSGTSAAVPREPAGGAAGNRFVAVRYLRRTRPGHPADALVRSGTRSFSVMESRLTASPAPESAEPGPSLAEDLPELYRTILERVAELERIGARREAGRVRETATRIYSEAWHEAAR